jgi:hypothetical protein
MKKDLSPNSKMNLRIDYRVKVLISVKPNIGQINKFNNGKRFLKPLFTNWFFKTYTT